MKYILNILLFLLFISLHIDMGGYFVESQILFYSSALGLFLLSIIQKGTRKCIYKEDVIVSILLIFLLLRFVFKCNECVTYWTYNVIVLWLLFFVFRNLLNKRKTFIKSMFVCIVICVCFEVLIGMGQLIGLIGNNDSYFILGGSLSNPGAYAGYLSVVVPVILSILLVYRRNKKAENLFYILTGILILMIYLIIISCSRGAWLACLIGCLFVINHEYLLWNQLCKFLNTFNKKVCAVIVIFFLIVAVSYILYQYKADSAFGRLLIWKIILKSHFENVLFGSGIGSFGVNYGNWQADYFANGNGVDAEIYVADYVTCAYNEFLQILVEQGAVGLCLWLLIFIVAIKQNNVFNSSYFIGAKASLYALIVLMFVSYPLETDLIYFHLIICLSIIFCRKRKNSKPTYIDLKQLIYSLIGSVISIYGLYNIYGYKLMNDGLECVYSGQINKGIIKYKKAFPILKEDGIFLFYYGSALSLIEQYEESNFILKLATQRSSMPNEYILIGNNYCKLRKFDAAEKAYKRVIFQIPSKIYPQYLMVKMLTKAGYYEDAVFWSKRLLETREKVHTTAAKEIKEEIVNLLNEKLLK